MTEFTQNSDLAELGITEVFGGAEPTKKKTVKKEKVAEPETTEEE